MSSGLGYIATKHRSLFREVGIKFLEFVSFYLFLLSLQNKGSGGHFSFIFRVYLAFILFFFNGFISRSTSY